MVKFIFDNVPGNAQTIVATDDASGLELEGSPSPPTASEAASSTAEGVRPGAGLLRSVFPGRYLRCSKAARLDVAGQECPALCGRPRTGTPRPLSHEVGEGRGGGRAGCARLKPRSLQTPRRRPESQRPVRPSLSLPDGAGEGSDSVGSVLHCRRVEPVEDALPLHHHRRMRCSQPARSRAGVSSSSSGYPGRNSR